jgi:hypothetical protein
MIEQLTLTVPELAARWHFTSRQVLEYFLHHHLPLYFPFDGLVFDIGDEWHRFNGDFIETQERDELKRSIDAHERQLKRNVLIRTGQLKLTEWEDALSDDDVKRTRAKIDAKSKKLRQLEELLEQRESERRSCSRNGAVRAGPETIQAIAERELVAFPRLAYLPGKPVFLTLAPDAKGYMLDGHLIALEESRHAQQNLTAGDLFATMEDVKAIEAAEAKYAQKAISEPAVGRANPSSGNAGIDKMKKAALVSKYQSQWPSIETDICNASRTELKDAQLGKGFYNVTVALEWARQNGKIGEVAAGAATTNSIFNSPTSVKKKLN